MLTRPVAGRRPGQDLKAARAEEEGALRSWLEEKPDVTVSSHGGMAPEQWYGTVDGRSFYFRERHDHWRIELDDLECLFGRPLNWCPACGLKLYTDRPNRW